MLPGSDCPQPSIVAVMDVLEIAIGRCQYQERIHSNDFEGAISLGLNSKFDYVISSNSGCMAGGPATWTSAKRRSPYTRGGVSLK